MRHRREISIGLFVLALIFFALEAGLWVRSISPAHNETDKQNIVGHRPPSEIPAVAGSILLIVAAVIVSIPPRPVTHKHRYQ